MIQTALTTTAAALFAFYSQYKQRQGRVEDALRRTLFSRETVAEKIKRLVELAPAVDLGMSPPSVKMPASSSGDKAPEAQAGDPVK